MRDIDLTGYPPALAELLRGLPVAPLGPGEPIRALRGNLQAISLEFASAVDGAAAAACRAGLWLAFNFLEESHAISQEIHTVEGSYWHALMHRREPDYSNSKYWFRNVGRHPIYESLCASARDLASGTTGTTGFVGTEEATAFLTRQTHWDAPAFVDLCQANSEERSSGYALCGQIQRVEWMLLFAYCYEKATRNMGAKTR